MSFADPGTGRSIVSSGVGPQAPTVSMAEACKRGDVLGYSSGWKRALATVGTAIQGRVIALADCESGKECPVSPRAVVSGYSGATPGASIYVAEGTDYGKVTETAPSTSGDATTITGIALSATTVMFILNSRADTTA